MKNIQVGVIGVGYLGRFHAQKYAGLEGVDLVGVADIDSRQGEQVAKNVLVRALPIIKNCCPLLMLCLLSSQPRFITRWPVNALMRMSMFYWKNR